MSIELRREISLRDLVLFHITAILSLRWTSMAAARGPSSISLWLLSFLLFFLPVAYVVIDFSRRMPQEGGIYQWTKSAFGPFHGFICAWSYFVSNLFYFPSLLGAVSAYLAFMIAGNDQALQDNTVFVILFSLASIWIVLWLNLIGVKSGKWVENIGGLAVWIPGSLLVLLGIIQFFRSGSATEFAGAKLFPNFSITDTWSVWSNICFAFAGFELACIMNEEIKDPQKNVPRSIYLAGSIITCCYVLGTWAILVSVDPGRINMITGIMQAISAVFSNVGLSFLTPVAAALLTLGGLGCVGAWLAGAGRLPYAIGVDRYLPPSFGKIHPRWGTPHVSLIWQGVLSTVILLMNFVGGSTAGEVYRMVSNATAILYFIPFIYLFASHFWLSCKSNKKPLAMTLAAAGFMSTLVAVTLAGIPPQGEQRPWLYILKVDGMSLLFVAASMFFYFTGKRRIKTMNDGPSGKNETSDFQ